MPHFRALAICVAFAFTLFNAIQPLRAEDCTLVQAASLDMTNPDNRSVEVRIGINDASYPFIVDTGGVYTMLFDDVAAAHRLKARSANVELYDATGKAHSTYVMVPQFALGKLRAENLRLVVLPRESKIVGQGTEEQLGGILAPDLLIGYDVEFDFRNRKVNLFSQRHCEGQVVYWTKDYAEVPFEIADKTHIRVTVMLDEKPVTAIIDTGATATSLLQPTAAARFGIDEATPGNEQVSEAQGIYLYRRRFGSLTFSGVTVSNPMVHIRAGHAERAIKDKYGDMLRREIGGTHGLDFEDMILGLNVLSRLRIYIAYKEKVMYVSAGDAS